MLAYMRSLFSKVLGNKWNLFNEHVEVTNTILLNPNDGLEDASICQISEKEDETVASRAENEDHEKQIAVNKCTSISRRNCEEILTNFTECILCLQPLQHYGPCACPVCGGLWCERCTNRVTTCPWCRAAFDRTIEPCLTLKRLVNNLELPCRNYILGCNLLLTAESRNKHEEACKFDPVKCFVSPSCSSLLYKDFSEHLKCCHSLPSAYAQSLRIDLKNIDRNVGHVKVFVLLHNKNAFVSTISIKYDTEVKVEVNRVTLGYLADRKMEKKHGSSFVRGKLVTKSVSPTDNSEFEKFLVLTVETE